MHCYFVCTFKADYSSLLDRQSCVTTGASPPGDIRKTSMTEKLNPRTAFLPHEVLIFMC